MDERNSNGVKDLETMMIDIKLSTERVYAKLDQLSTSIARLEGSFNRMDKEVSDLEKKLIILDQAIPEDLYRDLTLIKNAQQTQAKIMWLLAGASLTALAKIIADIVLK